MKEDPRSPKHVAVLRKTRNCSYYKEVREKTDKQLLSSIGSPVVVGNHEFLAALFCVVVGFS